MNNINFELIYSNKKENSEITSITILDNYDIVCGYMNRNIIIYDNKTYNLKLKIREHNGYIKFILKLKNNRLASTSFDKLIILYKLFDNNLKYSIEQILTSHTSSPNMIIEFNDNILMSCGGDGKIRVWNREKINNQYQCETIISGGLIIHSILKISNNEIVYYQLGHYLTFISFPLFNLTFVKEINGSSYPQNMIMLNERILIVIGNGIIFIDIIKHEIIKLIYENIFFDVGTKLNNHQIIISLSKKINSKYVYLINLFSISEQNEINLIEKYSLKGGHLNCIRSIIKYNENFFITGSEDCFFKIWELFSLSN
jgi:WD40 repeat protein